MLLLQRQREPVDDVLKTLQTLADLQKDEEKRLSLNSLQAKLTYHQLIEFGYKLRKPKIEFSSKI